jgi:DHA3 family macrolide efflux protein-like MFS transporter
MDMVGSSLPPDQQPNPFAFRWLWLGQLISNLGTQSSLYGIGLWSFERQGQLLDFAAVAFVVQLAKILVLPLLGQRLPGWPAGRVMLIANGFGATCTLALGVQLLLRGDLSTLPILLLLAIAAMAEAALVLCFASLIPVLVKEPSALARANGLFVSGDGLVLSLAPFAGSWLVGVLGLPGVLLLDGVSFAIAMVCVLRARLTRGGLGGGLESPRLPIPIQPNLRLRCLWRQAAVRPLLVIGTTMAFVYAATEVLFPAWLIAGPGRARLGPALLLGAVGYLLGYQIWTRWGWRRPRPVLGLGLFLQSLILMGAGLVAFEERLGFWYGGLLLFSLVLPMALAALQTLWQQLVLPEQLPRLLAQRYRLEWLSRLVAFAGSAVLVDRLLRPALGWPHWPAWLIGSLGQGPGRPLAVGLGAMGWVLFFAWFRVQRSWVRT